MGIKKKRNLFRKVPLYFFRREAALISEVCTPLQESFRMVTYEKQLKELNEKEIEFGNKLDTSLSTMDSELADLDKKYPNGQIDLDAGTISF